MRLAAEIAAKMIEYSEGNLHDINHFMKVWGYAKTIGELEGLDERTQLILEAAALTHDIACPLCREKYGSTEGRLQEQEGAVLVSAFLQDTGLTEEEIRRVSFLVGHHHTYTAVDGIDYRILLEADYLVNADESRYAPEQIRKVYAKIFKTDAGIRLLQAMYSF